jgi:hypothetical protein
VFVLLGIFVLNILKTKIEFNKSFFLVCLEPVDINGDEFQNIEIPSDTTSNSIEITTVNADNNSSNQTSKLNILSVI